MRMGIDENYPKDGVVLVKAKQKLSITLYADIREEQGPEGEKMLTADVVSFALPAGSVEKADIIAHFDYYYQKAAAEELKQAKEFKEGQVQLLLTGSDYKPHKVIDGAMTEEEYAPWKALRQEWRDAINAIRAAKDMDELEAITWDEEPKK